MQGFNINQVDAPPTTVTGQIVPPTGGGGWGANCQPGIDGSTPDADMFNDLIGNVLRVCQAGSVVPTPNRYDDLLDGISRIISRAAGDVEQGLAGSLVPAGTYLPYAGFGVPSGFLLANGALVSRSSYSNLFNAIGTTYGAGDGASTFNLPDTRGVGLRGLDSGRGLDPGRAMGSYQADSFASHGHPVSDPPHTHNVADPLHAHGTSETPHVHHVNSVITNVAGDDPLSGTKGVPITQNGIDTNPAVTGLSVNPAPTGIGIYGASSGVAVQPSGDLETRGKNLAVNFIIKF